jgi:hypothetical protein
MASEVTRLTASTVQVAVIAGSPSINNSRVALRSAIKEAYVRMCCHNLMTKFIITHQWNV